MYQGFMIWLRISNKLLDESSRRTAENQIVIFWHFTNISQKQIMSDDNFCMDALCMKK